jgi:hypothetical protein
MDIETLAAEPIFQPRRMEALLVQLNQIQEKIQTYQMTKDTELNIVLPKYTLQFQCTPTTTTDTNELSETESSNLRDNPGRRFSRRNNSHPYRKPSASVLKKNTLPQNGEADRH